MYKIENQLFKAEVKNPGAELCSFFNKTEQLEYIWQADPQYWAKHSPVLFPIVGTLKENKYIWQGKEYNLNRHGFAREMDFTLVSQSDTSLLFSLKSSEESLKVYPFEFELQMKYSLSDEGLKIDYKVINTGNDIMLFSLGTHPAFNCPLFPNEKYQDYFLKFEKEESVHRWFVENGLLSFRQSQILDSQDTIPLNKRKFDEDALVFKDLKSQAISLRNNKLKKGIKVGYTNFPFMGIWATPGADFICIEPWAGIADNHNSDNLLENKEGIRKLAASESEDFQIEIIPEI